MEFLFPIFGVTYFLAAVSVSQVVDCPDLKCGFYFSVGVPFNLKCVSLHIIAHF